MHNALFAAALSLLAVLCIVALVSGMPFLDAPLPGGLPAGNALAWLAHLGFSAAALFIAAPASIVRALARLALALSATWLPVSIVLAGNLGLNFSGVLGTVWLCASAGLSVLVVATVLMATAAAILRRGKGAGAVR